MARATIVEGSGSLQIKGYYWAVIAGALFAVWLAILRLEGNGTASLGLIPTLEAASFLSCMLGMLTGSRAIRARFEAIGSNKARALADAGYMQQRFGLQLSSALATASIWSLLAERNDIGSWTALPVFIGFLLLLPLINRVTGWTSR